MDAAMYLVLGLLLGVGLTFAAQASISSGWLGKRQPPPVSKP